MIGVSIFSNDLCNMPQGVAGLIYIGRSIQCEPLDQTDLKDGVDASYEVVGNRHMKEADRWVPQGLGGL